MKYIIIFFGILLVGCKKPKEGSVVFWYNSEVSSALQSDGVENLFLFTDGALQGSWAPELHFDSAPGCDQGLNFEKTKDGDWSENIFFEVKDETNKVLWSGSVEMSSGKCFAAELTR